MKSPRIHPKQLIGLTLVVLTSLFALSSYFWNRPLSDHTNKVQSSGESHQPISTFAQPQPDRTSQVAVSAAYGKLPLSFEANHGQTDPAVKFISRGKGYSFFLTGNEAVLALRKNEKKQGTTRHPQSAALRMKLIGANPQPQVAGLEELPGKVNYFIGSDPKKWRTNVSTFGKVLYQAVYFGIDLAWYGNQQQLEYDFIVAPGADPGVIALEFEGAERIEVDAQGDLVLHTDGGQIRQHRPIIYQEVGGIRQEITGGYTLEGGNQVGFQVGAYDANRQLVIDPVLAYSTYLGRAFTVGEGIAVNTAGEAYLCSSTDIGLPTVTPMQGVFGGGPRDAYVAKLNAAGTALIYSTYLGGNDDEQGVGIALDASGNAYAVGITKSTNFPDCVPNCFPTTVGAFQAEPGSSSTQGFIAKLNAAGTALIYSTYLGGSQGALASGIAVDSSGNAYATGRTTSPDFPLTAGAYQTTIMGDSDIFVIKLNPTGSSALYSTLLGGSGRDVNGRIAVDLSGNAYINGYTDSANFPTTANAFQFAHAPDDGLRDAFVAKLDPAASGTSQLVYSTFLGGTGNDESYGLSIDSSGAVYVTGSTESTNFPRTTLQETAPGGRAAFVTKLNPASSGNGSLIYSAILGGSGNDDGNAIAVDTTGNAYITGGTTSANFPTVNPLQQTLRGPMDAFVLKLNVTGSALVYSTYLGGSLDDSGLGIAVDNSENAFVTGQTRSQDFPTTPTAFQPANGGSSYNAFVVKISPNQPPIAMCQNVTVSAGAGCTANASIDNGSSDPDGGPVNISQSPSGPYPLGTTSVTLTVTDNQGASSQCIANVTVIDETPPLITTCPTDKTLAANIGCQAVIPNLIPEVTASDNCTASVDLTITQSPAAGTLVSPGTHTITVTVTDGAGNSRTCRTTLTATNSPPINVSAGGPYAVNESSSVIVTAAGNDPEGGTLGFAWDLDNNGTFEAPGQSVSFSAAALDGPGIRTIKVQISDNCGLSTTAQTTVTVQNIAPTANFPGSVINEGGAATLTFINQFDTSPADLQAGFRYSYDCNNDGIFEASDIASSSFACPYSDNGLFTAKGRIKDKDGGFNDYTLQVQVNNVPPAVGAITAPTNPLQVNSTISPTADFSDAGILDTHTAVWDWGDGSTSTGTVAEANGSGSASGSHIYTAAGVYTVTLAITDDDGGSALSVFRYVVFYDPSAGFVTGAGWINSPPGAYVPAPALTGKAHFGFVSRYQPGATTPEGQTRFEFKTANLDFRSTSYEWLVVAGKKAQYKGAGTVNGIGDYRFMLTVIDGQQPGGGGQDKFRIRIWNNNGGGLVYDNQLNAPDNDDPTTGLGGGSIVIHKSP